MCLYPKIIRNPRYLPNNKNKGVVPIMSDHRQKFVAVGCGNCIECRKQKAREWQIRLTNEIKEHKHKYFVTLTFSNENLKKLCKEAQTIECNAIATIAVRRFLERWRKDKKTSLRHWLITELGHENTERIHLHGIIFSENKITNEELQKYWQYGKTDTGQYCNQKSVNYIIKYVTKIDETHKGYRPIILNSAGIGRAWAEQEHIIKLYKYKGRQTKTTYKLPNGREIDLPIYYRNIFWTEKQRMALWSFLLDKDTRYVRGIEIQNASQNEKMYYEILDTQQKINKEMGYGDRGKEWQKEQYNITLKMLQRAEKISQEEEKYKKMQKNS